MTKGIALIAVILFVAVSTVVHPEFLGENAFLNQFVGSGLLSLQAVILTITFASVANIHLSLNKIVQRVYRKNLPLGQDKARPAREEINSNAWLLFWAFIATASFLLIKGMFVHNEFVASAMNGLSATSLAANLMVFHDIYSTIFAIASSDVLLQPPGSPHEIEPNKDPKIESPSR